MRSEKVRSSHLDGEFIVRAVAWTIALAAMTMIAASVVVAASAPAAFSPIEQGTFTQLSPVISVILGAVIIQRRGTHAVGWLFCGSGLMWAVYHLGVAGARHVAGGEALPAAPLWVWASTWPSFAAFGLAPVLVLFVFPTGRLAGAKWRHFLRFAVGAIIVGSVAYGWAPGPTEDLPSVDNPWGIGGTVGDVLNVLRELAWPMLLISVFGGVLSLRARMRAGGFEERQQIKWLFLAGGTLVVFIGLWGFEETFGVARVAPALAGFVLPLVAVAVAVAILKHRLYDIDVLINRTLVYVSLSAVLAAVYLGAVFLLQRALSPVTADSNIAIAASTLAVAALFRPARASLQHFIDRRFYRSKYNATATLSRFATGLRNEVDMDALTSEMLALVGETLQPSSARLWLKGTDTS